MPLYALDDDDLIHAADAESGTTYWCTDCFGPVKRRLGKAAVPHFYHTQSAPRCRLYSKTEDHMLAQVQLQKSFPPQVLQLERPFVKIDRVADVCWESEKIVFEIQCSPMTEKEAEMRIRDYASLGYHVVWLLDDRRYNKQTLRPAEAFLRSHSTYFLSIQPGLKSEVYDQFEIFSEEKRVKRGKRFLLDLQKIRRMPNVLFKEDLFPRQIVHLRCAKYFAGDRMSRALQNSSSMPYWRALERQYAEKSSLRKWLEKNLFIPYANFLDRWIKRLRP